MPAVPALLAASGMGIPTVLHEQNAVLGRANRFLASLAMLASLTLGLAAPAIAAAP